MNSVKMSNIELLDKANTLVDYLDRHMELNNANISDIRTQLRAMEYLTERRKEKRVK